MARSGAVVCFSYNFYLKVSDVTCINCVKEAAALKAESIKREETPYLHINIYGHFAFVVRFGATMVEKSSTREARGQSFNLKGRWLLLGSGDNIPRQSSGQYFIASYPYKHIKGIGCPGVGRRPASSSVICLM